MDWFLMAYQTKVVFVGTRQRGAVKTVLVTVDALRPDHLSQYGYKRETTPAVDRLLEDGTKFDAAFANGTNTGVSLPSILTSRYFGADPARNGPNLVSVISQEEVSTAGFHSNTLFSNTVDSVAGFDYYRDYQETDTDTELSLSERAYETLVDSLRPAVERLGVRDYAERYRSSCSLHQSYMTFQRIRPPKSSPTTS